MIAPDNNLPCAQTTLASFHPLSERQSAAFLACEHVRLGVMYRDSPQPHLIAYPPLRLLDRPLAARGFLSACLRDADRRCRSFSVDPLDNEVTWRIDLPSADPRAIDEALGQMRGFFNERWSWIRRTAREGQRREIRELLHRALRWIMGD